MRAVREGCRSELERLKEEVTEREERAAKVLKGFEGRVKELRGQYDEEREGWEREVGSLREGHEGEVRALKRRREEAVRNECAESVKGVRVVLEREKTEALEIGGWTI